MLGYGGKKKWEVGNFFSIKLDLEKGAPPYFLETATFANGFVALKMRLACKCPRSTNRLKIIFFQIDVYLSTTFLTFSPLILNNISLVIE